VNSVGTACIRGGRKLVASSANYGAGMLLYFPHLFVLPLETHQNAVDHNEEDEGDREDAMASVKQGHRSRAEVLKEPVQPLVRSLLLFYLVRFYLVYIA
jgi:hypothetical protein